MNLEKILEIISHLPQKNGAYIIAIDGKSAAGKSTFANELRQVLNASVIHMDDFFLPLNLRTQERFNEPGGNIHYERFEKEVLPHLANEATFSYKIFDCRKMDYHGTRMIGKSKFRIVEGSYSCHPRFGDYADLKLFLDIEPEQQMNRILKRNGMAMAERFRREWIPYEEKYFKEYKIKEKSNLVL